MKSLKSKLPCSKCGKTGHWHKDKECPMFNQAFKHKKKKGDSRKKGRKKKLKKKHMRRRKKVKSKRAHVAYVMTLNGLDLKS